MNESAVQRALEIDQMIYEKKPVREMWTGTYIADGRKHGLFGQEANFALNMTVPLLIECGFIVPESVYDIDVSQKDTIPEEEYEYVQSIRDKPRSLEVMCRDSIRRYFRERQIHRFVDCANIPQMIMDFILLKPLLMSVPKDIVV